MALHRDIFWIGRQWAVTGFGMQTVNQKHDGQYDIPVERLWDDDLPNGARGQKWFNPDDFNKGLEIARARHPKPPPRPLSDKPISIAAAKPAPPPLVEAPPPIVAVQSQAGGTAAAPKPALVPIQPSVERPSVVAAEVMAEPAKPTKPAPSFAPMRVLSHPARLLRVWHARRR